MLVSSAGCHSAFINATVLNQTGQVVRLLEVDYPSASFGTQDLAPHAVFHYRFKVVGEGATKITWTDAARKDHTGNGPTLHEGQEGQLTITLEHDSAAWQTALQP